jgi:septal ring factor EnvC (AmiA/AmiB activator)
MAPDDAATAAAFRGAAQALQDSARSNKQAESHHRRQARKLTRQLDAFQRECERLGISFELDTDPHQ